MHSAPYTRDTSIRDIPFLQLVSAAGFVQLVSWMFRGNSWVIFTWFDEAGFFFSQLFL